MLRRLVTLCLLLLLLHSVTPRRVEEENVAEEEEQTEEEDVLTLSFSIWIANVEDSQQGTVSRRNYAFRNGLLESVQQVLCSSDQRLQPTKDKTRSAQ